MSELLREIQEDIRRERTEKIWHSFGRVMVASSIVIVLATVGIVAWQHQSQKRAMERTARLLGGIDRMKIEDYKGAITAFDALIAEGAYPYDAIASLRKADAQSLLGDREGAAATIKALAGKKPGADRAFIDLARLSQPGAADDPSRSSPFYGAQAEWKAWSLMDAGKEKEAAAIFTALRDDETLPPVIRDRARLALSGIAGAGAKAHE